MKESWRVVKAVKPSGNSGSVYVPREWIGQSVEIRLFNAEEVVLEALYPYAESIVGIYLYGPHSRGMGSPEEDIDVLVISDKDMDYDDIGGLNVTSIVLDKVSEYAKEYPAEYASIISEAVPLMNEKLLDDLRAYKIDESAQDKFYSSLDRSIAIARSLAREGDYSSAAYALIQRLKDYSVLSSGGKYNYGALEDYASERGITKERFACLFEVYEAKKNDNSPDNKAAPEDITALLKILEEILGRKDEAAPEEAHPADMPEGAKDEKVELQEKAVDELSRENLLDKARRFREKYGGSAI